MVTDGPITSDTFQLRDARLHFVGVGGSGMSGLARMAASRGAICTGSDLNDSDAIADLRAAGVAVTLEQNADSLPGECDIVVVSAAIGQDHPEVVAALERNIRIVKYAQMLGRLMHNRTGVAIAGTHGKSSTTSMLCHVLLATQRDPSFIIGARCEQLAGGSRAGDSDILVAEACEYDRSFHNYHPRHGVILNIEEDHLDYYAGLEAIVESFATFARQVQPDGSLLMQHESPHRLAVTAGLDCKIESIGFAPQADWQVDKQNGDTLLKHQRQIVAQWRSPLPGEHMAYNAAVAVVTAHRLGVPWEDAAGAIANFRGLDRRMQKLGAMKGVADVTIIDDYGHHPTEVETTLRALRAHYQPERLICVFQPHQHSRTQFLMEQFAVSFGEADIVIVPHIYFVRDSERERQAVRAADLVDRLRNRGVHAMHLYPFEAIVEQLRMMARPGDLIVTMGAGDVYKIGRALIV